MKTTRTLAALAAILASLPAAARNPAFSAERMAEAEITVEEFADGLYVYETVALPVFVFDDRMQMHFNGLGIDLLHFVPWHGPVGRRADLEAYVSMLGTIRDRIARLIAEGATLDQVIGAEPTAEWDETMGDPTRMIDRAYASLSR